MIAVAALSIATLRPSAFTFRHAPPVCVAGTYDSEDWWSGDSAAKQEEEDDDDENDSSRRWLRLANCDVLPPPPGRPCAAVIHFVGGALVGASPRQTYGSFLEGVSDSADVAIVATPCTGLETGLDHWQAASEVMLRWAAAMPEVNAMLEKRKYPKLDALPVLGLGHSLGAKLLLLLGSDASMAEALGRPRCANALLCFNNYSARKSVPLLEQAVALGKDDGPLGTLSRFGAQTAGGQFASLGSLGEILGDGASAGLRGAAGAVGSGELADKIDAGFGALGNALGLGDGLPGGLGVAGGDGSGSAAESFAKSLDKTAAAFGMLGKEAGAAGQRASDFASAAAGDGGSGATDGRTFPLDDEFTPGPQETDSIISSRYSVGRNLLVRFGNDDIDQSSGLARLLQKRFTDDVTGIGGRLDFKKLDGTHVTPNAPRLPSEAELERMLNSVGMGMGGDIASGLSEAVAGMREVAGKASDEREAASETVAEFVRREARKAASG